MTEIEELIAFTEFSKGNRIEVPTRIVLKKREFGYVSRFQRLDNNAEFWGHYTNTFEDAKKEFEQRVEYTNTEYPEGSPSHVGKIFWNKNEDETA